MTNITFKIISHNTPKYFAAVNLREDILRKPLGLTFAPDEFDKEKDHIQIAGFKDDEVVATAVLVSKGMCIYKMQRVAVKSDLANTGIGSKMMAFCENHARALGAKSIYCHARDSAVSFYLKNGYIAEGNYFIETTIVHLKMIKAL